ncbi:MAG: VOC family protein [Anaerolineae bacterium]
MKNPSFKSINTILYCQKWSETVAFYRDVLKLEVNFASDWFIEFRVGETAFVSVADERRATIKSGAGAGLTITLQVEEIESAWHYLRRQGLEPGPIKEHAWSALVFYFYDPEGHRLELWSFKRGTGR